MVKPEKRRIVSRDLRTGQDRVAFSAFDAQAMCREGKSPHLTVST